MHARASMRATGERAGCSPERDRERDAFAVYGSIDHVSARSSQLRAHANSALVRVKDAASRANVVHVLVPRGSASVFGWNAFAAYISRERMRSREFETCLLATSALTTMMPPPPKGSLNTLPPVRTHKHGSSSLLQFPHSLSVGAPTGGPNPGSFPLVYYLLSLPQLLSPSFSLSLSLSLSSPLPFSLSLSLCPSLPLFHSLSRERKERERERDRRELSLPPSLPPSLPLFLSLFLSLWRERERERERETERGES